MRSAYELQVVRRGANQVVAFWPPGLDDERDLVDAIVERIRARERDWQEAIVARVRSRGVGLLRTEAHVIAALREAMGAVVSHSATSVAVRDAVESALLAVKSQVKP